MKMLGNHGTAFGHHVVDSASGGVRRPSTFGRVRLTGKAGDVVRVDCTSLQTGVCQNQAMLLHAIGGAVSVALTLEDVDVALNPDIDANIWAASEAVTAGQILSLASPVATVAKITFTQAATVILAAV